MKNIQTQQSTKNKKTIYFSKNKRTNILALILLTSFAVSLLPLSTLDTASADFTWHPYLTVAPNPVGVGQQVIAVFGFTMPTDSAANSYYNWSITITDPDGKVKTATGLNTESTGSTFYAFTPDKAGNWTIKARYPGGYANIGWSIRGIPIENVSIPAVDTNEFRLNVQEEQIPWYQFTALPSAYWEFPIYGENQAWSQIAGNWLMSGYNAERGFDAGAGAFNPYTTVPNTAHILWTKPQLFGGIVGGDTSMTYYTGQSYRRELLPPVIINGRMYYNVQEPPAYGFNCINLATGETIWFNNGTYAGSNGALISGRTAQITMGQVLTLDTMNWHGGLPFLWSTGSSSTWAVWNAYDGSLVYTIANVQTPSQFMLENKTGTLLAVKVDVVNDRLILWNSTLMFDKTFGAIGFYNTGPRYNIDWNLGVQMNVSIPHIEIGNNFNSINVDPKDPSLVIVNNQVLSSTQAGEPFQTVAFSLKDGQMLWNKTRDEGTWENVVGGTAISVSDDCYAIFRKETRQIYVYSVTTGVEKWVSEPRDSQWGMYMQGMTFAYGNLYAIGYDGMIYTYDAPTGHELWTWGPVNSELETPYGVYPLYGGITVADNKLIVQNGEHSANSPLYPGERMYVIDAENGTTLWSVNGWYQQPCTANSIIVAPNGYDGNIYCFGKGPSKVTVSAPDTAITLGQSLVIKGAVTDISAGASLGAVAKNFPEGLPCVSDEGMSQWMSYVYQQQPLPLNTTGVQVSLSVIDSNNNYREIGTTTSDASGKFSYQWKPDIEGKYTVIASFAGSESYWPSSSQNSFAADPAPATPPPTDVQQSMADMYFVPATIGLFIAIVIVGLLTILVLRKRP